MWRWRCRAPKRGERQAVLSLIRRSRDEIAKATGAAPPSRLRVTVHPSVESFGRATGQPWWVSGATDGAAIDLLPITILRQQGQLDRTIRHEVTHALLDGALAKRPMWVREGAAAYFADAGKRAADKPGACRLPDRRGVAASRLRRRAARCLRARRSLLRARASPTASAGIRFAKKGSGPETLQSAIRGQIQEAARGLTLSRRMLNSGPDPSSHRSFTRPLPSPIRDRAAMRHSRRLVDHQRRAEREQDRRNRQLRDDERELDRGGRQALPDATAPDRSTAARSVRRTTASPPAIARGRSARRSHAGCASARQPIATKPAINDNASSAAITHRNQSATRPIAVNSHDTSSQPKRAMNHALIWPLRIAIQASTRLATHQISNTISAAGTTPGIDLPARAHAGERCAMPPHRDRAARGQAGQRERDDRQHRRYRSAPRSWTPA